ncbi:GDSL-type esterase/lipase family protein [Micromonospora zamorensis]|uniref:GDSL-type esterase/lipase family protein n=1 Tax=Micromonospora zamorensis TaxID=709883 RepID=UPI002E188F6D
MSHSHSRSWLHKNRRHGTRLTAFFLALVLVVAGSTNIGVTQAAAAPGDAACSVHGSSFDVKPVEADSMGLRVGCARDSGQFRQLANNDDDVVAILDFNPVQRPEQFHELLLQKVAVFHRDQTQGGLSLGESFARQARESGMGYYSGPTDTTFGGSIQALGNSIVIVVPVADIGTTGFWDSFWKALVASLVTAAVSITIGGICLAAFNVGAPLAAPFCLSLGGAIGGGVGGIVHVALKQEPFDFDAWAEILAATVAGALLGYGAGRALEKLAQTTRPIIAEAQKILREFADKYIPWRAPLTFLANAFTPELADIFFNAVARLLRAVSPSTEGQVGALRVMVVGDSMSQGAEGDWTWRYRLWDWFRAQNVAVNFVGPYYGTTPPAEATGPTPPRLQGVPAPGEGIPRVWGQYAAGAPAFDSDHFAVWGRQAAQVKNEIHAQVAEHKPDLLLVGLGFNDLGWFVDNPDGTIASMRTLVSEARAANPNIKLALANIPQRTRLGVNPNLPVNTDRYNTLLATSIPSWSTSQSPVALVDWRANYACGPDSCPDGYDGLHPNARGEFKIAQAFERTLVNNFRIGTSVPAIPNTIPARPTPVPRNVVVEPGPQGLKVTWDAVFGAHGYTVRSRLVGSAEWGESRAATNRHDTLSPHGLKWEYQVRTDNGDTDDQKSAWTSPTAPMVASPTAPPGPAQIVTRATSTGFDITWGETVGAVERYGVIYWDQDDPGAFLGAVGIRGHAAHIDGLKVGHRYLVSVSSWDTSGGGGVPNPGRPVLVGGGTPAAPSGLKANALDASSVYLTWNKSTGAAGYRVWVRNPIDGSEMTASDQIIMETTWGVGFLIYGALNYEFCVTAVNGALESGMSNCVKPVGSS